MVPKQQQLKTDYELIRPIWDDILQTFLSLGYEFHYFGFFNLNNIHVKIRWQDYKVTPQLFEIPIKTVDFDNNYQVMLDLIKKGNSSNILNVKEIDDDLVSLWQEIDYGWKKQDLQNAIIMSGLNRPSIEKTVITKKGKQKKVLVSPLAEMLEYPRAKLPGFSGGVYIFKLYYETIYRKVFNTQNKTNWIEGYKNGLESKDQLINVLVDKYGFNFQQLKGLTDEQLIEILSSELQRRSELRTELKENIPQLQPAITYQPRSIWIPGQISMLNQFAPELKPYKEINLIYTDLYNLCLDPNSNIDQILKEADQLDLRSLVSTLTNKNDICRVLLNYVERTQTRKLN